MKEFDSRYIDGTIDSGGQYRLDVDVNTLTFNHHELMSREHVLASRLTSLARQLEERKKLSVVEYHVEKVTRLWNVMPVVVFSVFQVFCGTPGIAFFQPWLGSEFWIN